MNKNNVFYDILAGILIGGRDIKRNNNIFINCDRPAVIQIREVYLQELIEQYQTLGIEEVYLFTLTSRDYLQNPFVEKQSINGAD